MSDKKEKCNDRELLEMAAKAAGIELCNGRNITGMHPMMNLLSAPKWNPLTDDGDALRLTVALKLQVTPGTYNGDEFTVYRSEKHVEVHEYCSYQQDDFAATRRSIVRAAAAIGSAM